MSTFAIAKKQKPPSRARRRFALRRSALDAGEGGDGEKVGQEEDTEGEFGFPEDGFDDGGQGRVEETAQIGRHVKDGLAGRVDSGAVRDDGGDFGNACLAEAGAGKFDDSLLAEPVEEPGDGEGGGLFDDGAEQDVVKDFAPSADDAVNDDIDEGEYYEGNEDEREAGLALVTHDEVAEAEDQAGGVDDAEDEVHPGNETCGADSERRAIGGDGLAVNDDSEIRLYDLVAVAIRVVDDVIFVIGGGYNWGMVRDVHRVFLLLMSSQKPLGFD